ncbi:uncharacterized protein si:dkey-181m9.8 isoform X1 [Gadus morhua]|uniref:uncharacterized protein si:dkey-181m9.8 isoform X1 n=1 Tax=Gadus morhua TaxID=8049 RepID=UPI0011B3CFDD|nr:uncharacterized protein LOC115548858 isoform X1 [Gadus morhua]
MSSFPEDLLQEKLTECQYSFPDETLLDVRRVRAVYKDLRLHVDYYPGKPEKKGKKLLYLDGTIPVLYKEYQYNTPVCIWLHENHPVSWPRCWVRPSVSMVINSACPFVDAQGLVILPCLSNWTQGVSNLTRLIDEMRMAFQKVTPIYARILPASRDGDPVPSPGQQGPSVPSVLEHGSGSSSSPVTTHCPQEVSQSSHHTGSQSEPSRALGLRPSYTDELLGIDFSTPQSLNPFLRQPSSPSFPPPSSSSSSSFSPSQPTPPADVVNLLFRRLQLDPQSGHLNTGSGHQAPGSGNLTPGSGYLTPESGRLTPEVDQRTIGSGYLIPGSGHLTPGSGRLTPEEDQRTIGSGHLIPGGDHRTTGTGRLTPRGNHRTTGSGHLTQQPELAKVSLQDGLPAEKAALFWSLMTLQSQNFQPLDVLEAVKLNKDLPSALKYLSHTCPICEEQVTFSKIIAMTHCPCAFCEDCFKAYFTTAIKEKTIDKLVCPLCSRPDTRGKQGMEDAVDYFNLLDTQIRHYLEPQSHELFQKKLRDRALQDMPNFRWCAHCSFGMLHEADRLRMDCPNCRKSTCSRCKSPWIPEHQGVSCEDFKRWQLQFDPNNLQSLELDSALLRNKIECPNCQLVFYLSKGGCLHFSCSQCQHEFCGSCSQPFILGSNCLFSKDCSSRGLHAHHPRNCLYHLRDWTAARLQLLLQCYKVPPSWLVPDPTGPPQSSSPGVCWVLEVPDDSSSREEPCGRPALPEHSGVCGLHHKERLVEVVRRAGLDPATLYGRAELEAELKRWYVTVAPRAEGEAEQQYLQRLRKSLTRIPLSKDSSSPSSQPSTSTNRQPGISSSSASLSQTWATTPGRKALH